MTKQTFDINKLRIASKCPVGWEAMTGDERTRYCDLCRLNVYNVAEMTGSEVQKLIAESEGRVCGRLYQRADGTIITKDCPVGLRAYQKRVARFAGAALAAVLGLFSVSFGQKDDKKAVDAANLKITRAVSPVSLLEGTVTDPNGAVMPNAEILLFKDKVEVVRVKSDENGAYRLMSLAPGIYSLEVRSMGFKTYKVKNLKINASEGSIMDVELKVYEETVMVGYLVCETGAAIDTSSTTVQTTITKDMMNRLPH